MVHQVKYLHRPSYLRLSHLQPCLLENLDHLFVDASATIASYRTYQVLRVHHWTTLVEIEWAHDFVPLFPNINEVLGQCSANN